MGERVTRSYTLYDEDECPTRYECEVEVNTDGETHLVSTDPSTDNPGVLRMLRDEIDQDWRTLAQLADEQERDRAADQTYEDWRLDRDDG